MRTIIGNEVVGLLPEFRAGLQGIGVRFFRIKYGDRVPSPDDAPSSWTGCRCPRRARALLAGKTREWWASRELYTRKNLKQLHRVAVCHPTDKIHQKMDSPPPLIVGILVAHVGVRA